MKKTQYMWARSLVQYLLATEFDTIEELRDYIGFLKQVSVPGCESMDAEVFKATMRVAYEYAPLAFDKSDLVKVLLYEGALRDCVVAYTTDDTKPAAVATIEVIPAQKKKSSAPRTKKTKMEQIQEEIEAQEEPDYDALLNDL